MTLDEKLFTFEITWQNCSYRYVAHNMTTASRAFENERKAWFQKESRSVKEHPESYFSRYYIKCIYDRDDHHAFGERYGTPEEYEQKLNRNQKIVEDSGWNGGT